MPELIILAFLTAVVPGTRFSPIRIGPRILVAAAANLVTHGVPLGLIAYTRQSLDASSFLPDVGMLVVTTLVWLATFEVMARWRPATQPVTILVYGALIWVLQSVISGIGFLMWYATLGEISPTSLLDVVGGSTPNLGWGFVVGQMAATVALYLFTFRVAAPGTQRATGITVAHGGIEMSPSKTETTRLLGAAAVLNGAPFRRRILDQLHDDNRATAPEVGLDVRLLAQICCALERHERMYEWAFVGAIPAWLVMAAIQPVVGTLIAIAATAALFFRREHQRKYSFASHFSKETYAPESVARHFECELGAEITSSLPDPGQNLVVYRGFTPFLGAGVSLGGWSFVINLDKPKEAAVPLQPTPFELDELYEAIDAALAGLALEGLTASEVFFVEWNGCSKRSRHPTRHSRTPDSDARSRHRTPISEQQRCARASLSVVPHARLEQRVDRIAVLQMCSPRRGDVRRNQSVPVDAGCGSVPLGRCADAGSAEASDPTRRWLADRRALHGADKRVRPDGQVQ